MGQFYVTTPIYYVNDIPHVGHAYTTIIADAVRRVHRLFGDETYFLTGTDEHGQKIERKAAEEGKDPKAFCDEVSARFKETWPKLDVEYDRFIRTTDPDHEAFVADLWKKIADKGDLYLGDFEGWNCVGCEGFKTEKELEQPGNLCPIHKKPVEWLKEPTYFFRLSKWQEPLLRLYEKHPELIQPETRRNEVLAFVREGLNDLSCSRVTFKWGIPVPGDPAHVMYVWFDALTNYRSALGHGDLTRFWSPKGKVVHLVGKDILRFHTVYWPAFLLAAGYSEEELPNVVFAHGFLTVDGEKMSKSLKNGVDPLKVAGELGADVLRYHLLRAVAFGQDGDFDHEALLERYNADLGKNVGNLLNRVLGLCTKNGHATQPKDDGPDTALETDLDEQVRALTALAKKQWDELAPHLALETTMKLSNAGNAYVDKAAPWAEAKKGDAARVAKILSRLLRLLEALSVMLWPAMPRKADAMRAQLGLAPIDPKVGASLWPEGVSPSRPEITLAPAGPLFPTFDDKAQKELLDRLVPKPAPAVPAAPPPSRPDLPPVSMAPATSLIINYDHFSMVDLRVGLVKTCEKVPKKDKLLRLTVDLGEAEPRTIVAGLALTFQPDQLVGRRVVVVANLAPREFGKGLVSHGMLLATGPSEALHLATIGDDVAPGSRLK
ncbi:MAG: methionine--tRNA ligase [Labilithrix sp.]|nr:methionine--tRNA ligase [Labilithrix sp.]MCW5815413.1 methionine--tRNA ligase [Labilithrix sp.]